MWRSRSVSCFIALGQQAHALAQLLALGERRVSWLGDFVDQPVLPFAFAVGRSGAFSEASGRTGGGSC